jgi:hypothetical protein
MHSNDVIDVPRYSQSWMAASFAFAFLVGFSLSIPLLEGLSRQPTGYDEAFSRSVAPADVSGSAESIVEMNQPAPCLTCAASEERVPAEGSPYAIDPVAGEFGPAGIEV